jgi:hypothetical protein
MDWWFVAVLRSKKNGNQRSSREAVEKWVGGAGQGSKDDNLLLSLSTSSDWTKLEERD